MKPTTKYLYFHITPRGRRSWKNPKYIKLLSHTTQPLAGVLQVSFKVPSPGDLQAAGLGDKRRVALQLPARLPVSARSSGSALGRPTVRHRRRQCRMGASPPHHPLLLHPVRRHVLLLLQSVHHLQATLHTHPGSCWHTVLFIFNFFSSYFVF